MKRLVSDTGPLLHLHQMDVSTSPCSSPFCLGENLPFSLTLPPPPRRLPQPSTLNPQPSAPRPPHRSGPAAIRKPSLTNTVLAKCSNPLYYPTRERAHLRRNDRAKFLHRDTNGTRGSSPAAMDAPMVAPVATGPTTRDLGGRRGGTGAHTGRRAPARIAQPHPRPRTPRLHRRSRGDRAGLSGAQTDAARGLGRRRPLGARLLSQLRYVGHMELPSLGQMRTRRATSTASTRWWACGRPCW